MPGLPLRPRILFMRGRDPFSLGVQMMTLSEVSHVAVAFMTSTGAELGVHALTKGVCVEPRAKLEKNFAPVAEFEVLPDVRAGLAFVLRQVGKPYDNEEIVSRLLYHGLQAICPWITTTAKPASGKWTCGRLAMALDPLRTHIPEWWVLDPNIITPVELLNATAANSAGSFRRVL